MIQSGQVQTSVNGLTIQNGLTTNMVSAKAATGEEVPEQVIDANEINDTTRTMNLRSTFHLFFIDLGHVEAAIWVTRRRNRIL